MGTAATRGVGGEAAGAKTWRGGGLSMFEEPKASRTGTWPVRERVLRGWGVGTAGLGRVPLTGGTRLDHAPRTTGRHWAEKRHALICAFRSLRLLWGEQVAGSKRRCWRSDKKLLGKTMALQKLAMGRGAHGWNLFGSRIDAAYLQVRDWGKGRKRGVSRVPASVPAGGGTTSWDGGGVLRGLGQRAQRQWDREFGLKSRHGPWWE